MTGRSRIAAIVAVAAASALLADTPPPSSDPHAPLNEADACAGCHRESGESVEPHEFVVSIVEACSGCHDLEKLARSHPVGVDPRRSRPRVDVPRQLPLEDGRLSCGSCHQPHAPWLSATRSYPDQPAAGDGELRYRTYYLRVPGDPEEGFAPLCKACHRDH